MRIAVLMVYGAYALLSSPATAQSHPASAEPTQAGARVPGLQYESAFRSYVPYREQPLEAWREVNDEVGRVGGHLGMFRGAGQGEAQSQPGAPASVAREAAGQPPAQGAPAAPPPHHTKH